MRPEHLSSLRGLQTQTAPCLAELMFSGASVGREAVKPGVFSVTPSLSPARLFLDGTPHLLDVANTLVTTRALGPLAPARCVIPTYLPQSREMVGLIQWSSLSQNGLTLHRPVDLQPSALVPLRKLIERFGEATGFSVRIAERADASLHHRAELLLYRHGAIVPEQQIQTLVIQHWLDTTPPSPQPFNCRIAGISTTLHEKGWLFTGIGGARDMLQFCLEYLAPIAEARNSELGWLLSDAHPDAESLTPLRRLAQARPARELLTFRGGIREEDISRGLGDTGYFEGQLASDKTIALRFQLRRFGDRLHLSVDYNPIGGDTLSVNDYKFEHFYAAQLFDGKARELNAQKPLWSTEVRLSTQSKAQVPLISIRPEEWLHELAQTLSPENDSYDIAPCKDGPSGSVSLVLKRGDLSVRVVLSTLSRPTSASSHDVNDWYYLCAAHGVPNRAGYQGNPMLAVYVLPQDENALGFLPDEREEVIALTESIAAFIGQS